MGSFLQSIDGVVEEIMRIHRSLPTRPGLDEVEAAMAIIQNVEKEEHARIDGINRQRKAPDVPDELFFVLQEMQKNLVFFQSKYQKKEALQLIDLERTHALFDDLLQRASKALPSSSMNYSQNSHSNGKHTIATPSVASTSNSSVHSASDGFDSLSKQASVEGSREVYSRDDSFVKKAKPSLYPDGVTLGLDVSRGLRNSSLKPVTASGEDSEKLSLIKLASMFEISSKKGTRDLNLQGKLTEQIEWLPDSLGKLSGLCTLDLSENRIVALPNTIGGLSSLTKLDLHSNRLEELPDSFGDLFCLVDLDLRGNRLRSLPSTFGKLSRLDNLDLSSNQLSSLPSTIGNLISLKILNVETNEIEELPHMIGQCSSLVEIRADFNHLKAVPEAVGRLESLEVLTLHYNKIKSLPTTMASLLKLKELDVSFNELESVPESLCLATNLVKLNVGRNFADLQALPRSIGNLEMLEELDISNNQIRVLPDSFAKLSNLQVLHAEETPLEVPPRHVAEMGAQAVVQYMAEYVAKRDSKTQTVKQKKSWAQFCFFSRPNKRKHYGMDYVKA
ncbi:plant intracellular Ras-group-related LRR protein 4 [Amborella trichopoda]|uniref:Disease resistance R13L4/SHOC-2-like LRR domain-containing protein n=1 Tax=Amborella trichopoda TaxID=13333 RepID=W1PNG1_AMBTC|nr:plant intracellular Ras-group-related LRR protein 4 [Amborella trichopoda]XP_011625429.1 plant intracellular Ras-group-related LRR protein 4 [Amborella trichopoda]ERN11567.1 hypothetical protein AMTR_s00022p00162750 [Amborella trichopoda]|eukprot:XP_006849986.1 plant intracellular Ras-group-related LRR protein 4 [Amborella trichopoda]